MLPTLIEWNDDGRQFALATVVCTRGSAPRETGSMMGVREDGLICGSVSGGCLDGAVVEACLESLKTGRPEALQFPSRGHEGLMCGGESEVWIDPFHYGEHWSELVTMVQRDEACALSTRMDPFAQVLYRATDVATCSPLDAAMADALRARRSGKVEVAGETWFVHVFAPRPRLVIIGAVHIAQALICFARQVGFQTIVIDPRTAFAQEARFDPQPDAMRTVWPQEALSSVALDGDTYAVALTHDPKIDDAALEVLIRSDVAYVGALGSKTTAAKRRASLLERGLSELQIDRIHGPIGLDIGAENPEEIALAIMAEIVKVRRARG